MELVETYMATGSTIQNIVIAVLIIPAIILAWQIALMVTVEEVGFQHFPYI